MLCYWDGKGSLSSEEENDNEDGSMEITSEGVFLLHWPLFWLTIGNSGCEEAPANSQDEVAIQSELRPTMSHM